MRKSNRKIYIFLNLPEAGFTCCSIWLELKLDKEALTGLWCWGEVVAEADEPAGGADPNGGGTTGNKQISVRQIVMCQQF